MTSRTFLAAAVLAAALCLTACGSDNNDNDTAVGDAPPTPPSTPQRGDLLETPPALLKTYAPQELIDLAGQNDIGKVLVNLAIAPKCSVSVHQLKYQTV